MLTAGYVEKYVCGGYFQDMMKLFTIGFDGRGFRKALVFES
jgi:hypothetical protein